MRQPESKRAITRDQYDAVLLDLDGVITDTAPPSGVQNRRRHLKLVD